MSLRHAKKDKAKKIEITMSLSSNYVDELSPVVEAFNEQNGNYTIKLDRSFFYCNEEFDANDKIVVKTIIDLAHRLGKKIVAEGIEDLDMINFLKECNCDLVQGYCYAKPVPRTEFLNLTLKNN